MIFPSDMAVGGLPWARGALRWPRGQGERGGPEFEPGSGSSAGGDGPVRVSCPFETGASSPGRPSRGPQGPARPTHIPMATTTASQHAFLASLGIQDHNPAPTRSWLECTGPVLSSARRRPARSSPPSRWRRALSTRRSSRRLTRRSRAGAPCQGCARRDRQAHGQRHARTQDALGRSITLEMIVQEGWGEVQECIDIADFAVGLSRRSTG